MRGREGTIEDECLGPVDVTHTHRGKEKGGERNVGVLNSTIVAYCCCATTTTTTEENIGRAQQLEEGKKILLLLVDCPPPRPLPPSTLLQLPTGHKHTNKAPTAVALSLVPLRLCLSIV